MGLDRGKIRQRNLFVGIVLKVCCRVDYDAALNLLFVSKFEGSIFSPLTYVSCLSARERVKRQVLRS
jgi:hypothetical protein